MEEANYPVNGAAIKAMGGLKVRGAVDRLCTIGLSTNDWRVKGEVLWSLGQIGDPNTIPTAERLAEQLRAVRLPDFPESQGVGLQLSAEALSRLRQATSR
jgi:hypothetical protein